MRPQRIAAEALGTGLLLATVIGSGIMGERLAGGNVALALLVNTLATGAILVVLITMFGSISGAHFNPAVTLAMRTKGQICSSLATAYIVAQIAGGCLGTLIAHGMFDLAIFQASTTARTGAAQWFAEFIASFGLLVTIFGAVRYAPQSVAAAVALYITSAYWFTASTSFAASNRAT